MKMAFFRNTNIFETRRGNVLTVCSKWPKDYLCKIWGENIPSGARYGCECNVLHDGGIRFINSYVRSPIRLPSLLCATMLSMHYSLTDLGLKPSSEVLK